MGSCTRRHFLLSICILQLVSTVERQVFDFLGYMWAPILANFFHIIFVIFGFFGAYQYRPKYIITYTIWNLLWMAWNSFIICFYLSVGVLDKDSDILNLGLGSVSWWEVNGWGCHPVYSTNITNEDPYSPFRPTSVSGCLLDYTHVEIIHAALQCLLAILAVIGGICLSRVFLEEDDSFDFMGGDSKTPRHLALQPMYVSYTSLVPSSQNHHLSSNAPVPHRQIQISNTIPPKFMNNYSTPPHISHHVTKNKSLSRASLRSSNSLKTSNNSFRHHVKPNVVTPETYSDPYQLYDSDSYANPYNMSTRSPNLNRTGSRSRSRTRHVFHVDQIRSSGVDSNIIRTKSQDRLSQSRKHNPTYRSRPKSLCTNSSFVEH